jgi:hypothetical protein
MTLTSRRLLTAHIVFSVGLAIALATIVAFAIIHVATGGMHHGGQAR